MSFKILVLLYPKSNKTCRINLFALNKIIILSFKTEQGQIDMITKIIKLEKT